MGTSTHNTYTITQSNLWPYSNSFFPRQTGDLLQKKIRVRPDRNLLVQRHILNGEMTYCFERTRSANLPQATTY